MPTRLPIRFLIAVAAVGVVIRLVFALGYWVDKPLTRDEREYLSLARSLAAGHGFVYDEEILSGPQQPFGRAPGYPAWLAVTGGGGSVPMTVPTTVKVVQSVVGAAGILLVGLWAWHIGGPNAARAAAVLAAVYPPLVWIPAYALSEAVFWPLGLAAAWWLNRESSDAPGPPYRAFVTGIVLGLIVLFRAATTLLLAFTVLWLLWQRRPGRVAALILGTALVIGPWAVRNHAVYGRFVLVATDGGITFWTGNNALARGEGDMASNPELKTANTALRARYADKNEDAMEPVYYHEALEWMRAHPLDWIALEARKVFYLIVPIGPSYRESHSPLYFWASVLSYLAVLPLAIMGLWSMAGRRSRGLGLWLLFASAVAVCLVFFPQERFRMPVIDSTLVICAGVAIGRWWRPAAS